MIKNSASPNEIQLSELKSILGSIYFEKSGFTKEGLNSISHDLKLLTSWVATAREFSTFHPDHLCFKSIEVKLSKLISKYFFAIIHGDVCEITCPFVDLTLVMIESSVLVDHHKRLLELVTGQECNCRDSIFHILGYEWNSGRLQVNHLFHLNNHRWESLWKLALKLCHYKPGSNWFLNWLLQDKENTFKSVRVLKTIAGTKEIAELLPECVPQFLKDVPLALLMNYLTNLVASSVSHNDPILM